MKIETRLPTEEEYRSVTEKVYRFNDKVPIFQCPKCGGTVYKHIDVVLACYPPQYHAICDNCGYHTYVR